MKITLDHLTQDAQKKIGQYASICYDSDTSDEACKRRAVKVAKSGHLACLRFAHATFLIEGISRACSHQLVRSKFLDFLQRSQRYCDEGGIEFVLPDAIMEDKVAWVAYDIHMRQSRALYRQLREAGVKKEDARMVLPQAATTDLYVVGSLQAWVDFIALRNTKEAQGEIREVAQEIQRLLHEQLPELF